MFLSSTITTCPFVDHIQAFSVSFDISHIVENQLTDYENLLSSLFVKPHREINLMRSFQNREG
jgi:hypothetical protein